MAHTDPSSHAQGVGDPATNFHIYLITLYELNKQTLKIFTRGPGNEA